MSTHSSVVSDERIKTCNKINKDYIVFLGPLPFEQPDIAIRDTDAWKAIKDLIRHYLDDSNGDAPHVHVETISSIRFEAWAFVRLKREKNAQRVCDAIDGNTWYGVVTHAWWESYSLSIAREQHQLRFQNHGLRINPPVHRTRTNPQPLWELPPACRKQIHYCPSRIHHNSRVEQLAAIPVNEGPSGPSDMLRTPLYSWIWFPTWYACQTHPSQQNTVYYPSPDQLATARGNMLPVPQHTLPGWPIHHPIMAVPGYPPVVAHNTYPELRQAYHNHHTGHAAMYDNANAGAMTYPSQSIGHGTLVPRTMSHTTQPATHLPSSPIKESNTPHGRYEYQPPIIVDGTVKRSVSEQARERKD